MLTGQQELGILQLMDLVLDAVGYPAGQQDRLHFGQVQHLFQVIQTFSGIIHQEDWELEHLLQPRYYM